ncbi:hypothetical protein B0J12DRAFT_605460 [Macrophomina phaseolina]|uniref:Zn(2)-C6 fungal-type domain-containing protein n=1 Tax=Macrophomina phaseolina TaxID=35725 RepID=A0ABQ8G4P6_9PEZI|nr:hypothetical protein B0J12DRAFT_605460 [Macrophomina phaseolina]
MPPYAFRCPQAGCDASYTRKSHLTRHMGKHQAVLRPCPWCKRTFTRQDSFRKHAKLHHPCREVGRSRSVAACLLCKRRKTRCDGNNPCGYCSERRLECVYDKAILDQSPRFNLQQRMVNVSHYIHLYFERVHPKWPFLHRASFVPETEPPMLVQAVVMTGILASGEKGELPIAMLLYRKLSDSIRLQRERWDVSSSATVLENASWPMSTYQGILLCIVFGTMVECIQNGDDGLGVDMEIFVALVRSCHRRGMFNYYHMVAQYHKPSPDDAEALMMMMNPLTSLISRGLSWDGGPRGPTWSI